MNTQRKYSILAVDDDEVNLMILTKCVQEAGYTVKEFESGDEAWDYLRNNPNEIDIALLDKMMPGLNGNEMLRRIKNDVSLRHIPVIMQTGDVGVPQMREGLENGVYYYLTKPFHPDILTAIIHSAANECTTRSDLLAQKTAGENRFIGLMQEGYFNLKTHEEAVVLATTISQATAYPEFVSAGLIELLFNAIEHGNLEIGYEQKSQWLLTNCWKEEVAARAGNAEYGRRMVHIHMEKTPSGVHLTIRDEGKGFDWNHYMYDDQPPGHVNEANGRGIAKALIMLDDLRYAGDGNEVHCTIYLTPPAPAGRDTVLPMQKPKNLS